MDGELDSIEVPDIINHVKKTDELRNEWSKYHLIGDALRQPEMSTVDIASGIRKKLALEPTVLAPESPKEHKGRVFAFAVAASMVTAVAAVAWMGGQTMDKPLNPASNKAALQASVQTESTELTEPTVVTVPVLAQEEGSITDKSVLQAAVQVDSAVIPIPAPIQLNPAPIQLNDYLFAHEEFSPRTMIRGVSPYMRTVADPYKRPINR